MSDVPSYFEDDHFLIIGPTGRKTDFGGKTSLATWWADRVERDLVIFANVKGDDVAGVVDGFVEVTDVEDLARAVARGERRIVLTPTDHDWTAVSRRLEGFVATTPDDMSVFVVLDEVPELDEDAVLTFVRVHGNGADCQVLALAQSPTDVSGSILKQCTPVWVGPVPSSYRAWFRTHDFDPHYQYIQRHHEPYHWSVLLGPDEGDIDHFQPVPERYGEV